MAKKKIRKAPKFIAPAEETPSAGPSIEFRKSVLPNGVRVLTEKHPMNRAISCGIWVQKGTRDEAKDEHGLAHFLEHMVFKRTKKRNAFEISRDMEAVGGDLNAFTSRENTCFVSHSLREDLGLSLDVLSDLVCSPTFELSDIKKEKQVVVQEIRMAEEQLEDNIFDKYFEEILPKSPLGRPILGTIKSISGMSREKVKNFHSRLYTPENTIVSIAGAVDHREAVELVDKHLKFMKVSKSVGSAMEREMPKMTAFRRVIKRPSEQAHVLLGFPGPDFKSPLRFDATIVNTLLGGGLTSRLYQTIREDRGLVYSVYSQLISFTDSGMTLIYAGTDPKNAPDVVELTLKEIKKLKKKGVSAADLQFFKKQVRGQILLGADDIESRMNSLGVNEMVFGRYRSVDQVIADIENVSLDSVHEYIEKFFDLDQMGALLMGALPEAPMTRWLQGL